jgi:phenylacetate-coenzyme A ligase PaaK-like adenylate-forming protein
MNTEDSLYARSPVWLQNCFVSARGWQYRYRRASDRIIREHLHVLLQSQWWSVEQFRDYQLALLRAVLREAFLHVPYYQDLRRQLGCHPDDFTSLEHLRLLPVLDKARVRGNENQFINQNRTLSRWSQGFTSGTTGTPLKLYEDQDGFSRRWAFVARLRLWARLADPIHPRRVQFTGRNIVPNGQPKAKDIYWRFNWCSNSLLCSTTHLSTQTVPHYARKLAAFAPDLIEGYPSAVLILARIARRLNVGLPRPRAIVVSAETLTDDDRRELQEAYGCRVFNQYAASEPSCFWCDCEEGVLHVNPEYGITEILGDHGAPAVVGEEGDVVVTSCLNRTMPLIRYRLGDRAFVGPDERCSCGRRMPRIDRLSGRADDILVVPGRGYVGRLDPAFKGLTHIIETQIVQESSNAIRVLLVPAPGYDSTTATQLVQNLRAKLGEVVDIRIDLVERIPRGPNGKFRSVISKIKHQAEHSLGAS